MMLKRDRSASRKVIVSNVADWVKIEQVALTFSRFGRVDRVFRIARKSFAILFDESQAPTLAVSLHQTRQAELSKGLIYVRLAEDDVMTNLKRPKRLPGSFAVIDPPRSGNSLIPTLPSFLNFRGHGDNSDQGALYSVSPLELVHSSNRY